MRPVFRHAGARWIGALVMLAAVLWGLHAWLMLARPGRTLFTFDSAEYAIAGRELARTGVLATPYSYVGTLGPDARPPFPLLAGHPLLPLLEALVFLVFGAHSWGSLLPVAIGYLLTVVLTFQLARRAGSSDALAALAGIAIAGAPVMLSNATDGLSELPFAAAWTGALVMLAGFRRRPHALALGALLGCAHLARPMVVPTLPAWLVAVAWASGPGLTPRLRRAGELLVGFAPFGLSILIYKWIATGHPFTDVGGIMLLVQLAPEFQSHDVGRLLHPPDALQFLREHPAALGHKLARTVPVVAGQMVRLGGWVTGLAFVSWIARPRANDDGPLRLVAGWSFAAMAGLSALTLPRSHYLFPMLPAAVALGAGELERLGRAARVPRRLVLVLVAAVLAWSSWRPLAAEWAASLRSSWPTARFAERDIARFGAAVAARVPPGTLVASDMAPFLSWYADRPSVNLPLSTRDLPELRERHGLGALVLTNEWLVDLPGNEAWRDALEGRTAPDGWTLGDSLAFGPLRARLLFPR